ncbi:MAG: aminotransferase class IV [Nitrospira sp.]
MCFLNWREELTECTISNLFFISKGTVHTPSLDCGILDGITRAIVMTLAEEEGLPVKEGHYHLADLRQADECFPTNTSMEVMPVSWVQLAPYRRRPSRPLDRTDPGTLRRQPPQIPRAAPLVAVTNNLDPSRGWRAFFS